MRGHLPLIKPLEFESTSNSPVAPRRLSCQISANQREAETSANVNKHRKSSAKGNDVITNVISANQHFASTFSMQIFKFQRRSCKLSFLFPPRRQSAPESLPALWNVTLTKKFNVNVKITASWPTVILPKLHVKLYKQQKWTIKRLTRFHNPQNDFNAF